MLCGGGAGGRSGRWGGDEGYRAGGERRGGFGDYAFICCEEVWRGGDPRGAAGVANPRNDGELGKIIPGAAWAGGGNGIEKQRSKTIGRRKTNCTKIVYH